MLDFATRARSFATEDDARAYLIENQCDPSIDNLVRAGVGWVIVDDTPRPDLWKGRKPDKDETHAAVNIALDKLANLDESTSKDIIQLAQRIEALENEIAAVRASVRDAGDLTDSVADLRASFLAYVAANPATPSGGGKSS